MWKDFTNKFRHVSYELYRQVFEGERITFGEPSQDECDICVGFEMHKKEAGDHSRETCNICCSAQQHLDRAIAAREEYQKTVVDKSEKEQIFAVDMQKVILLPKMTIKEHFFVSRLVVFNETFAGISDQQDYVCLWHEGIRGRSACDVSSAYVKCLSHCGLENFVF